MGRDHETDNRFGMSVITTDHPLLAVYHAFRYDISPWITFAIMALQIALAMLAIDKAMSLKLNLWISLPYTYAVALIPPILAQILLNSSSSANYPPLAKYFFVFYGFAILATATAQRLILHRKLLPGTYPLARASCLPAAVATIFLPAVTLCVLFYWPIYLLAKAGLAPTKKPVFARDSRELYQIISLGCWPFCSKATLYVSTDRRCHDPFNLMHWLLYPVSRIGNHLILATFWNRKRMQRQLASQSDIVQAISIVLDALMQYPKLSPTPILKVQKSSISLRLPRSGWLNNNDCLPIIEDLQALDREISPTVQKSIPVGIP